MSARRKTGRAVNGIVVLDKPPGMTSNQALQIVKRLFQARKAGHTGSLDPLATGVLPICLGEATKVSGFLLDADKEYRAECQLGVRTRSGDAEGEVIETRPVGCYDAGGIRAILQRFTGVITQIPPMHSAIKRNGVPLYKLAHQGLEVERTPRQVTIYDLELLDHQHDRLVFRVRCSKGTYIRTLAEDIGAALGCGAHITGLARTVAGPFDSSQMQTLEALETRAAQGFDTLDTALQPMERALEHWPSVGLPEAASFYLRQGQPVFVPGVDHQGWVRLYEKGGRFLGMGIVLEDGRVAPRRLVNDAK